MSRSLFALALAIAAATGVRAADMYSVTPICGSDFEPCKATAINNSGQVVGDETLQTLESWPAAFLYSGGKLSVMGGAGSFGPSYNAINDEGQIAGYAPVGFSYQATVWGSGVVACVPGPPNTGSGPPSSANGINNSGQYVG